MPAVKPTSTCRLSGTTAAANSPSDAHATERAQVLGQVDRQATQDRFVHLRIAERRPIQIRSTVVSYHVDLCRRTALANANVSLSLSSGTRGRRLRHAALLDREEIRRHRATWFLPVALSTRPRPRPRTSSDNWVSVLSSVTAGTAALRRDVCVSRHIAAGGPRPTAVRWKSASTSSGVSAQVVELNVIDEAVVADLRVAPRADLQVARVANRIIPVAVATSFPST